MLIAAAVVLGALVSLTLLIFLSYYGSLWLQAFMSGADIPLLSLVGMSLRKINPRVIMQGKIMSCQAGLAMDRQSGLSTSRLEAHYLAGGDVVRIVQSMIAAQRAAITLDSDQAMAMDLAGRDILQAVQTSIHPRVINCPESDHDSKRFLSAVARNGVELRVRARVTVRSNIDQLVGGATERTIIARVGQGIIAAIGAADSHMDVMAKPSHISQQVLAGGLDSNTAFEIVSVDIVGIDVGTNIGARLQLAEAAAQMRVAQAFAERRLAQALANEQEMWAALALRRAELIAIQALIPPAVASAFRRGQLRVQHLPRMPQAD